jgi:DNA-binding CsgD family transcriptional regulator
VVDIGSANGYLHVDKDTLKKIRVVGDRQLVFQATNMRAERTGFHAKIDISYSGKSIGHDTFNVERNEDRVRLANSTYKQMTMAGKQEFADYPAPFLKDDLDTFCSGLQDAYVEGLLPGLMRGSDERREPQFVLKPYLIKDGGTIIFAPPGQGKSYVLWLMAVCIDAGLSDLWPVQQTRVLVVNLERSQSSVEDRLGNINQVLHLPRGRELHVLNARGRTLEQMRSPIARYVKQEGIGALLLDSLSRAGKGSLVDDDVVNAYCDIMNGFGIAWMALAHSPRADTSHVFGSQMFDAAADLLVKLESYSRPNGAMGISLDVTKRNDIGPQPQWVGALSFDAAGLVSIRRARKGEFRALEASESSQQPMDERVVKHLASHGGRSATQIAESLGLSRQNVSTLLAADERFAVVERRGQSVLYGLRDLSATGTDGDVSYDPNSGHPHDTSGTRHIDDTSDQEELPF